MDKARRTTKEKPVTMAPDVPLGDASEGITIKDMFEIVRSAPFTGDFSWMPSSPCMDDEGRSLYWPAVVRPDGLRWCQAFKELNIPIDFVDFITFQTCLFPAVDKGTYGTAKFLVENRADVNHKDKKLETCLWYTKNLATTQLLISHNADLNTLNADGEPPSFYFLRTFPDDHNILEALLDGLADPCMKIKDGLTPLHMAKSPDHVRLLVERGANVNERDKKEHTCLWHAVRRNCAPVVKALIAYKAEIDIQDATGQSLLLFAIEKEREDVCMELLANDSPPLAQANLLLAKAKKMRLHEVQQRLMFLESEFHVKAEKQTRLDNFLRSSLEAGPRQQVEAWIKKYKSDARRLWENGRTLLFFMANREVGGTRNVMEYLLSLNIDINARDHSGRTALFHCAVQGSAEVMRAMLENDADPNIPETGANTALIAAVEAKSLERVEVLLDAGVPVDCANSKGETALIKAAARGGSVDIVKVLIRAGAEVNLTSRNGKTPLFCAHDVDIINALAEANAEVDARDTHKRTTLFQLAQVGNTDAMSVLIKLKADVNAKDSFLETPIFHSVQGRQIEAMQLLLESNADLSIQTAAKSDIWDLCMQVKFSKGCELLGQNDYKMRLMDAKNNRTTKGLSQKINKGAPAKEIISLIQEQGVGVAQGFMKETFSQSILFTAAKRRTDDVVELVEFLLDTVRLDLELADDNDQTVLFYAARFGTVDVVKTLLNRKGSVEKLDKNGDTPLHYAVLSTNMEGKEQVFRLLLDAKASVNTVNLAGKSSLFHAMQAKSQSPIKLLIDNKANVNMLGPHGATALCFAHKVQDVALLLEYKADIEAKDDDGKTPVFYLSAPPFLAYHSGALGLLLASMANVDHKITTPEGERTALALAARSTALPEIIFPVLSQLLAYGADPTPYMTISANPKVIEFLQCFPRMPPRARLPTARAAPPVSVSVQVEPSALQSLSSHHPSSPAGHASSTVVPRPTSSAASALASATGDSVSTSASASASRVAASAASKTGDGDAQPCPAEMDAVPCEAPLPAHGPRLSASTSSSTHGRQHTSRHHHRAASAEQSHESHARSREKRPRSRGREERVHSEGEKVREPLPHHQHASSRRHHHRARHHGRSTRPRGDPAALPYDEDPPQAVEDDDRRTQSGPQASPQDDGGEREQRDPNVVPRYETKRARSDPHGAFHEEAMARKRGESQVSDSLEENRRHRSDAQGMTREAQRRTRSDSRDRFADDARRKRNDFHVAPHDDNRRGRSDSYGPPHDDNRRRRHDPHAVLECDAVDRKRGDPPLASHEDSRRGRSDVRAPPHEDSDRKHSHESRRKQSDPRVPLHDDSASRRRGTAHVVPHEESRQRRSDPRVSPHEDSWRKQSDDCPRRWHDLHSAILEDNAQKRGVPSSAIHGDGVPVQWGVPHVVGNEDTGGKRSAPHGSVYDENSSKRSRHARRPREDMHASVHHDTHERWSTPRKRSATRHGTAHERSSRHRSGDPHISYEDSSGRAPREPHVTHRLDQPARRHVGDASIAAWHPSHVDMSLPRSVSPEPEGSWSPPRERAMREYSNFSLPMDDWLNQSQSCEDTPPMNNTATYC